MEAARGIVFDLDDTIYPERDYVRSGFEHVASVVGRECPVDGCEIATYLHELFARGVRGNTFDRLLEAFPSVGGRFSVSDLVEAYRSHEPCIRPFPGMIDLLGALRAEGARLAMLSDGYAAPQRAKLKRLGLDAAFENVVFTGGLAPSFWKPEPDGFLAAVRNWPVAPHDLTYVGDNPHKDFAAPNRLGWYTIRVRMPIQLRYGEIAPSGQHRPQVEVASVAQLAAAILKDSRPVEVNL